MMLVRHNKAKFCAVALTTSTTSNLPIIMNLTINELLFRQGSSGLAEHLIKMAIQMSKQLYKIMLNRIHKSNL
jgi:hypothetical protein